VSLVVLDEKTLNRRGDGAVGTLIDDNYEMLLINVEPQ
jgi:hypothetical protein